MDELQSIEIEPCGCIIECGSNLLLALCDQHDDLRHVRAELRESLRTERKESR
jgi:hypothetical protein